MQNGELGAVGDLSDLLGDDIGVGGRGVLDEEHGAGAESQLRDMLGIGDVLEELHDGGFLRGIVLLGSGQEALDGGHETAVALAIAVARVDSDFALVGKQLAVNGVVFLIEVGDPPGSVEVNGGVAADEVTVHVAGGGGNGAVKGVVIHLLEDLRSFHESGILQAVGIDVLAADGFNDQGVPQHGGPGIITGHLTHGVDAVGLAVLAELEELVIGGGEMIPAGLFEEGLVVDWGEHSTLKGQDADLAVHAPGVKGAVGEVLAPAGVQIRGQVHELAGLGVGLDIEGGIEDADVRRGAGGDGGADLVAVGLIVGLLFDDDLDGAGVLGVKGLDQLAHVLSLGVGADPNAGEVDDDLSGLGRSSLLAAGCQSKNHNQSQKQCDQFLHFHSPF